MVVTWVYEPSAPAIAAWSLTLQPLAAPVSSPPLLARHQRSFPAPPSVTTRAYLVFGGSVTPPPGARKRNGVLPSRMFEGTSSDSTRNRGTGWRVHVVHSSARTAAASSAVSAAPVLSTSADTPDRT